MVGMIYFKEFTDLRINLQPVRTRIKFSEFWVKHILHIFRHFYFRVYPSWRLIAANALNYITQLYGCNQSTILLC